MILTRQPSPVRPSDPVVGPRSVEPGSDVARIAAVDSLKVVLAAGVILGHVAMTYGAMGSWIFEAPEYGARPLHGSVKALTDIAIALGALFAMGLFFLIAGFFAAGSLRRHGPAAFAVSRLRRLGTPVVVYVVVVMPALDILIGATAGDTRASLADQYVRSLRQLGAGPMWFVAMLLIFSLVLAGCAYIRRTSRLPGDVVRLRCLAVAAAVIAVASFALRMVFPVDTRQVFDLHVWLWPQCCVMFAVGVLVGNQGRLGPIPRRVQRTCGAAAALVVIGLIVIGATAPSGRVLRGGLHWEALFIDVMEGIYAISASLWVLALFQRRIKRQRRFARWCSRNAYGAYIAQGPVLVAFGLALHPLGIATELKLLVLAVVGTAGCFVPSDVARRTSALRRHHGPGAHNDELDIAA